MQGQKLDAASAFPAFVLDHANHVAGDAAGMQAASVSRRGAPGTWRRKAGQTSGMAGLFRRCFRSASARPTTFPQTHMSRRVKESYNLKS